MKREPAVDVGPVVRVTFAEQEDPWVEAAIDQWLRSIGAEIVERRSIDATATATAIATTTTKEDR